MAQSEAAIEGLALAYREDARGRSDAPVAHDHAAVMQCAFRMEKREHQLDRELRIKRDAGLLVDADRGIALDRDQGAELFVRQLHDTFGNVVHRLALFARETEDWMAAEFGESAAQLRLKNHDQRD